jgi:hypothetical protein
MNWNDTGYRAQAQLYSHFSTMPTGVHDEKMDEKLSLSLFN